MNIAIDELEQLRDKHGEAGTQLIAISGGKLFPCHALYLSILNRSLELFDGFILLTKNNNYGCCMALLRLQLDNVLRFLGVLHTKDIHETANEIFNGTKLSSLKDRKGEKLRDAYLVELLSKENTWVPHIYSLTSGYIHLSDQHVHHMLGKPTVGGSGLRDFCVGASADHVSIQHKIELIKAFKTITTGVFALLTELDKLSQKYDTAELEKQYAVYA